MKAVHEPVVRVPSTRYARGMRCFALIVALALAGCGMSSSKSAPGPFADVAGSYGQTLTSATDYYQTHPPVSAGQFRIDDGGTVTTSTGLIFHLTRNAGGSFSSESVRLTQGNSSGPQVYQQLNAPAALDSLQMDATEYWDNAGTMESAPIGSAVYTVVKTFGG